MKPIVFHPDAVQEAHDAADYYEAKRRGLGQDFRQELDAALSRVRQNPQWFAIVSGKCAPARCIDFRSPCTLKN